ncbi:MAG: DUF4389 domain-containing protein [Gaiellales bacterium]
MSEHEPPQPDDSSAQPPPGPPRAGTDAGSPLSGSDAPAGRSGEAHPIQLHVADDLRRSRVTTLLRFFLTIPHFIWQGLWGVAATVVAVIAWVAGLVLGRVPDPLHNFIAEYVRYSTRVSAYFLLAANPFPSFTNASAYPVDLEIARARAQGRLGILFRYPLAYPAMIASVPLTWLLFVLAVGAWFMGLAVGRIGEGMREAFVFSLRYSARVNAYVLLLTNRYPSFKS